MDESRPVSKLQAQMVSDIVRRSGLTTASDPKPVAGSLINQNYRIETDQGPRFARIYRKNLSKEAVAEEHAITAWAAFQGLPAVAPIALPDGRTSVTMSRRQVALFPWVDGRTLVRGEIDMDAAAVLGDLQGRVHKTLAGYEGEARPTTPGWGAEASSAALRRVVDIINFNPRPNERDSNARAAIERQLAVLESGEPRPYSDFDQLPRQPVHGDFQERNVLFDEQNIPVALVDWEMFRSLPRVLAVLRAITFMQLLEEPLLEAYLGGYGHHVTLTREECVDGLEMWWQSRLHNAWVYTARYIQGMREVETFVESAATDFERFADKDFRARLADVLVRCTRAR